MPSTNSTPLIADDDPILRKVHRRLCDGIADIPPYWALSSESLTRGPSAVGLSLIDSLAWAGGLLGLLLIGKLAQGTNVTFGLVVPVVALGLAVALVLFVRPAKNSPAVATQVA